jgi:hypothetical protein
MGHRFRFLRMIMKILKKEWFIWKFWKKGVVEKRGKEETKSMPHAPVDLERNPCPMRLWLSRQTGSRNLMVPKTLPTIWHTYVKLVTKYQISAINSCWEKCDEYMGEPFWSCNFFFINLPLKLFNFNFMFFFLFRCYGNQASLLNL